MDKQSYIISTASVDPANIYLVVKRFPKDRDSLVPCIIACDGGAVRLERADNNLFYATAVLFDGSDELKVLVWQFEGEWKFCDSMMFPTLHRVPKDWIVKSIEAVENDTAELQRRLRLIRRIAEHG